MSKKKIALLFGGASSEHEVSCMSVASVYENIDKEKYEPLLLGITKGGEWFLYSGDIENVRRNKWEEDTKNLKRAFICPDRSVHGIMAEQVPTMFPQKIDAVFPVLHGRNGEDGSMQGLLEIAGIPYVGCRVLSSALCMDKDVCHAVLKNAGVPQVKWLTFMRGCNLEHAFSTVSTELGYPVFVKPANAGSSVGITKAKSEAELGEAFALAFRRRTGRNCSCGRILQLRRKIFQCGKQALYSGAPSRRKGGGNSRNGEARLSGAGLPRPYKGRFSCGARNGQGSA